MESLSRFTVKAAVSSFALGIALLSVGCQPSRPPDAGTTANSNVQPTVGKEVPPAASTGVNNSIRDSQAAGNAYRDQAMKNGAAAGAASNGWR
jgi:hypothetical protein